MKKALTAAFAATLLALPMLGVARTYEAPYLLCASSYPVVSVGNAGRFHVVTNTDGPFMWVAHSENYGVYDAGTDFVTPFTSAGSQRVDVVWGSKRASCQVDVVPTPGFGEPYSAPLFGGYAPDAYGYTDAHSPNVVLTSALYPRLPNAGLEPQTFAAFAFAAALLLGAFAALYPHAKKIIAAVAR